MAVVVDIVLKDHDVHYKEGLLQLGIVNVAILYAAQGKEMLLELGIKVRKRIYVGSKSNTTNIWQKVPEHYSEPAPQVVPSRYHILALSILSFTCLWRGATDQFFFCEVQLESQPENERGITATLDEYGQGSDDSTRLMVVAESKRGCRISSVKALQRGESRD